MTNQEILEKAIQKAIDGGFNAIISPDGWVQSYNLHSRLDGKAPYDIIFNHDFAKALWGEELIDWWDGHERMVNANDRVVGINRWKFHLQQMVIAPDPIKYLGENI